MTDTPMTDNEIWEAARSFHERMVDEIKNPGDMLGVAAVITTNLLVAGVLAGLDPEMVPILLDSIQSDVFNAIKALSPPDGNSNSIQ